MDSYSRLPSRQKALLELRGEKAGRESRQEASEPAILPGATGALQAQATSALQALATGALQARAVSHSLGRREPGRPR